MILDDNDVDQIDVDIGADVIGKFLIADYHGETTSPPRHAVDFGDGRIVFTTGGVGQTVGFRAYETFTSEFRTVEDQVVAVWDTKTCRLNAVCIGQRLGALRTGLLGGLAVHHLAPPNATRCGLIGTGLQAEMQLRGILARRELEEVHVFSRSHANRESFAQRVRRFASLNVVLFERAEDALVGCEIAVLATDATQPVIDPDALQDTPHITTVGPKLVGSHELPLEVVKERMIASDSPQQIRDLGTRHMLHGHPKCDAITHLGQVLARKELTQTKKTLFLSAGLAGTEVALLAAAVDGAMLDKSTTS